jgi:hypothetical protein
MLSQWPQPSLNSNNQSLRALLPQYYTVQSLWKILCYRKTYRLEVTDVSFLDNHLTEGLPALEAEDGREEVKSFEQNEKNSKDL